MTVLQKIEAVSVTAGGSALGAVAGGPIGLGIGMVVGGLVDFWRMKKRAAVTPLILPPVGVLPTVPGFPPSIATQQAGGPVNITYTVNGKTTTAQYTPSQAAFATDINSALTLAKAGHGAGKEGELWVARAKVDGMEPIGTAAGMAQLRAAGYAV